MKYAVALLLLATAAHAEPRCTHGSVKVDVEQHRLEVALQNRCANLVTCKVNWRLRCAKESTQERSENVRIDAHGEERVTLSALSCGDGDWEIAPPRWVCAEPIPASGTIDGEKPRRHGR